MAQILHFSPGQVVRIFLEIKDGYGTRTDPTELPVVNQIILPGLTLAADYPEDMSLIYTGLYYFQFTLPSQDGHLSVSMPAQPPRKRLATLGEWSHERSSFHCARLGQW